MNPGEDRTITLMREFGEEALNSLEATDEEKAQINQVMKNFFKDGFKVIANPNIICKFKMWFHGMCACLGFNNLQFKLILRQDVINAYYTCLS